MSRDELRTLIRTANPVRDTGQLTNDDIDALFSTIERRTSMVKQDARRPDVVRIATAPPVRSRRVMMAAAAGAFVAVLGVVGGVAIWGGGGPDVTVPPGTYAPTTTEPTTEAPTAPPTEATTITAPPTTTTTLAPPTTAPASEFTQAERDWFARWEAAFDSGDVETFVGLFDPTTRYATSWSGVTPNPTPLTTWGDDLEMEMRWRAILDNEITIGECTQSAVPDRHLCDVSVSDSFGTLAYVLTVEFADGRPTRYHLFVFSGNQVGHIFPFKRWITETHPEDLAVMFSGPDDRDWPNPRLEDDSLVLWETRVPEYLATLGS